MNNYNFVPDQQYRVRMIEDVMDDSKVPPPPPPPPPAFLPGQHVQYVQHVPMMPPVPVGPGRPPVFVGRPPVFVGRGPVPYMMMPPPQHYDQMRYGPAQGMPPDMGPPAPSSQGGQSAPPAHSESLDEHYDLLLFIDDLLLDLKNLRLLLPQTNERPDPQISSLLQKMAEIDDDEGLEILLDLLMGLSTLTPTDHRNSALTPELAARDDRRYGVTLLDFELPRERSVDPKRVNMDMFDFEMNGSSALIASASSVNKFKPLLPPNLPQLRAERRSPSRLSSVNPLSPNKVTKASLKVLSPPSRPYESRPRLPSSSTPPLRKTKSTLNAKAMTKKPQKPKAKRTFSFDQYSSTLDFLKEPAPKPRESFSLQSGSSLGGVTSSFTVNLTKQKSYSFVMEPVHKMLEKETRKAKKKLSIDVNQNRSAQPLPTPSMEMAGSQLVSPTFLVHLGMMESPAEGLGRFWSEPVYIDGQLERANERRE